MNRTLASLLAASALAVAAPARAVSPDADGSLVNTLGHNARVRLHSEVGALAVPRHTIQFSKAGSRIDYVDEAGQDNLFLFLRLSADIDVGDRHTIVFLYQPIDLRTKALAPRDLVVDGATFEKGTLVNHRYGFGFWRGSWLRDLQPDSDRELALGAGLQIRNATIDFESGDGTQFRSNRDIGPVPLLKARVRQPLDNGWWMGAEVDGFYAPIKYINGSNTDVVGSILDASLRAGLEVRPGVDGFVNLRYVTGGAEGTSDATGPGDGFTYNYIHLVALSLGFSVR